MRRSQRSVHVPADLYALRYRTLPCAAPIRLSLHSRHSLRTHALPALPPHPALGTSFYFQCAALTSGNTCPASLGVRHKPIPHRWRDQGGRGCTRRGRGSAVWTVYAPSRALEPCGGGYFELEGGLGEGGDGFGLRGTCEAVEKGSNQPWMGGIVLALSHARWDGAAGDVEFTSVVAAWREAEGGQRCTRDELPWKCSCSNK